MRGIGNPLNRQNTMSGRVSLLTPGGREVRVDPETFRVLRRGRLLSWNAERGLRQMDRMVYGYTDLFRGQNPIRPATVRAFDPSRQRVFRRPPTLGDELAEEIR